MFLLNYFWKKRFDKELELGTLSEITIKKNKYTIKSIFADEDALKELYLKGKLPYLILTSIEKVPDDILFMFVNSLVSNLNCIGSLYVLGQHINVDGESISCAHALTRRIINFNLYSTPKHDNLSNYVEDLIDVRENDFVSHLDENHIIDILSFYERMDISRMSVKTEIIIGTLLNILQDVLLERRGKLSREHSSIVYAVATRYSLISGRKLDLILSKNISLTETERLGIWKSCLEDNRFDRWEDDYFDRWSVGYLLKTYKKATFERDVDKCGFVFLYSKIIEHVVNTAEKMSDKYIWYILDYLHQIDFEETADEGPYSSVYSNASLKLEDFTYRFIEKDPFGITPTILRYYDSHVESVLMTWDEEDDYGSLLKFYINVLKDTQDEFLKLKGVIQQAFINGSNVTINDKLNLICNLSSYDGPIYNRVLENIIESIRMIDLSDSFDVTMLITYIHNRSNLDQNDPDPLSTLDMMISSRFPLDIPHILK